MNIGNETEGFNDKSLEAGFLRKSKDVCQKDKARIEPNMKKIERMKYCYYM